MTISLDNTISFWNVVTGEELAHYGLFHTGYVYGADFQPGPSRDPIRGYHWGELARYQGPYYVTSGADGTARLWSWLPTVVELRRFTGHTDEVRNVVFSPDGKYILTASKDGTARLWPANLDETIQGVCALLTRDLTPEERKKFGISDQGPTCPKP